ncbi:potassium/sodium hyperpolarization-activated cyclic nucleotide-gated channel 4-like [Plodia interpunctella]|uniref:potassium/sodium hyperpolarization-activated cyclic nucleotide-gated channel 4-like n=1 Tax=Plodia interpunctella TaxID=58824 RepID=UPI002367F004|nr:potassium/sodium hyperpolarization-activated cyclic nucleotide-gated channel 4-like [Plodia interpunctella]
MSLNQKYGRHVCMLPVEARQFELPPVSSNCCKSVLGKLRELTMPVMWHHGSTRFIRSNKSMNKERCRQVAAGNWFVWHPYSPIKFFWDCFLMTLNFAVFLYMPLQVFYECPNPYDPIILVSDVFAFLFVISKFITGYDDETTKKVVLEPRKIIHNYLFGSFIFDLIGALPLQLITFYENCTYPTHTTMFLFKLLRASALQKQRRNLLQQLDLSYITAEAAGVLIRTVLFFHWVTYIHYQVPVICAQHHDRKGDYFEWLNSVGNKESVFTKYVINLYNVACLCIGAGYTKRNFENKIPKLLLTSSIGLIGLMYFTYTFTAIIRLIVYLRLEPYLYSGRLKALESYMTLKRLPKFLQHKINLFLNYKFSKNYFNEAAIMDTINEQIKQDINMYCCKKHVVNVPLFQDMPPALINSIIFNLSPILFMPGQVIVKYGTIEGAIYLIFTGTVAVMDAKGREVAHLRDGAYFGEHTLLDPETPHTVTIIALEITEIFHLSYKSFQLCLQPYPHVKRRLDDLTAANIISRSFRK